MVIAEITTLNSDHFNLKIILSLLNILINNNKSK